MRRWILAALMAIAVIPATAQAATYTVVGGTPPGANTPGAFAAGLFDGNSFYPSGKRPLEIRVGDTVKFVGGFHTATILGSTNPASMALIAPDPTNAVYPAMLDAAGAQFFFSGMRKFIYNPATLSPGGDRVVSSRTELQNSGLLLASGPKGYSMRFTRAGNYKLLCLIHPSMQGTISVKRASANVPGPRAAARRGIAEANADIAAAIRAHVQRPAAVQDPQTATVRLGAGNGRFSLFAFYPQALSVKAGTTITFRIDDPNEVHNVGFGDLTVQQEFLRATDQVPQGPGTPNQVSPPWIYGTDPAVDGVLTFTGATSHGNGYFATPVLDADRRSPLPQTAKVTVTTPGTYTMICQVHPQMVALLHVHA